MPYAPSRVSAQCASGCRSELRSETPGMCCQNYIRAMHSRISPHSWRPVSRDAGRRAAPCNWHGRVLLVGSIRRTTPSNCFAREGSKQRYPDIRAAPCQNGRVQRSTHCKNHAAPRTKQCAPHVAGRPEHGIPTLARRNATEPRTEPALGADQTVIYLSNTGSVTRARSAAGRTEIIHRHSKTYPYPE